MNSFQTVVAGVVVLFMTQLGLAQPDTLWTRSYGAASPVMASAVALTGDSGFVVAGTIQSGSHGGRDVLLVRFDTAGSVVWSQQYGGSLDDGATDVAVSADGHIAIGGWTYSESHGQFDCYTLYLTASGEEVWSRTDGSTGEDVARTIAFYSANEIRIAGQAYDIDWLLEGYVLSYDLEGNPNWFGTYGSGPETNDVFTTMLPLPGEGACIYAGYSNFGGPQMMWLWKEADGEEWPVWIEAPHTGTSTCILAMPGGNVVVGGYASGLAVSLVCLHSDGSANWALESGIPRPECLWMREDGNIQVVGAGGELQTSVGVAVVTPEGESAWSASYELPGLTSVEDAVCMVDGTGLIVGNTGEQFMVAALLPAALPVQPRPAPVVSAAAMELWPNPTNGRVQIGLQTAVGAPLKLQVYDLTGRLITNLLDAPNSAGTYRISYDASALATGTYFLVMQQRDTRQTQRFLLLK